MKNVFKFVGTLETSDNFLFKSWANERGLRISLDIPEIYTSLIRAFESLLPKASIIVWCTTILQPFLKCVDRL